MKLTGWVVLVTLAGCASKAPEPVIRPAVATETVSDDPDDPAIWVNSSDPSRTLILGTVKEPAPKGALVVFGLGGKKVQTIGGIDRPNNIDVEYGFVLNGKSTDIAVLTERLKMRLRVFAIAHDGLTEINSGGGLPVFEGQQGEQGAPMGIALYRRPRDGAIFAVVGRKTGPRQGYLWEYRLEDDGAGKVKGTKVREFGVFSGDGEIEAIAVDDAAGYVYYADEGNGIHKWHVDPEHANADRELAHFGKTGFQGDREGIAIYARPDGTGYIVCTDQLDNDSRYLVFRREGASGNPHDHHEVLKAVRGGADSTDGIEATAASLGPQFPHGILVVMNATGRNFFIYKWEDIEEAATTKLE